MSEVLSAADQYVPSLIIIRVEFKQFRHYWDHQDDGTTLTASKSSYSKRDVVFDWIKLFDAQRSQKLPGKYGHRG